MSGQVISFKSKLKDKDKERLENLISLLQLNLDSNWLKSLRKKISCFYSPVITEHINKIQFGMDTGIKELISNLKELNTDECFTNSDLSQLLEITETNMADRIPCHATIPFVTGTVTVIFAPVLIDFLEAKDSFIVTDIFVKEESLLQATYDAVKEAIAKQEEGK